MRYLGGGQFRDCFLLFQHNIERLLIPEIFSPRQWSLLTFSCGPPNCTLIHVALNHCMTRLPRALQPLMTCKHLQVWVADDSAAYQAYKSQNPRNRPQTAQRRDRLPATAYTTAPSDEDDVQSPPSTPTQHSQQGGSPTWWDPPPSIHVDKKYQQQVCLRRCAAGMYLPYITHTCHLLALMHVALRIYRAAVV